MLSTEVSSAICVQRFDDSRNSAIHTTYRISLRSSSMREPRYPLLRVVFCLCSRRPFGRTRFRFSLLVWFGLCELDRGRPAAALSQTFFLVGEKGLWLERASRWSPTRRPVGRTSVFQRADSPWWGPVRGRVRLVRCVVVDRFNDPSAGSPTER